MSGLMAGRRGVVMGIANDHSIAWGIARTLAAQGAQLAVTYQDDIFARRVEPLAKKLDCDLVLPCDATDDASMDGLFGSLEKAWGGLDFIVHAIAWSDKNELQGRYVETSRENFSQTLDVSCYSFTALAQRADRLMGEGSSLLTLTYTGAQRVMPNYNVMGVAKAALEASVRYLAVDLGRRGIRVNAISAGPMRTLAGSAVLDARRVLKWSTQHAALKRPIDLEHIGGAALYLLSDLSGMVTGEIHHVDAGYNIIGMPRHEDMVI